MATASESVPRKGFAMSAHPAGTYPYNHDGSQERYWDGVDWSGDPFMTSRPVLVPVHAPPKRPVFRRWWALLGKSAWS